jgi:hypothetical protein
MFETILITATLLFTIAIWFDANPVVEQYFSPPAPAPAPAPAPTPAPD